jgi:hypothetical protein
MSKCGQNDTKDIDAYIQEPTLHKAFPNGLYYHYINNGWPRVPFHYVKFDNFNGRMMQTLYDCHTTKITSLPRSLRYSFMGEVVCLSK